MSDVPEELLKAIQTYFRTLAAIADNSFCFVKIYYTYIKNSYHLNPLHQQRAFLYIVYMLTDIC